MTERLNVGNAAFVVDLELLGTPLARQVAELLGMVYDPTRKFEPLVPDAEAIYSFTSERDIQRGVLGALQKLVGGQIELPEEVNRELNEVLDTATSRGSCI